jgi:hypothetical protein
MADRKIRPCEHNQEERVRKGEVRAAEGGGRGGGAKVL